MRIVCLVPSATEIVCALGLAGEIVGISNDCDFPQEILDRPRLTSTKLAADLSSREIHAKVRNSAASACSLHTFDAELLRDLHPGLIITQEQCGVCALTQNDLVCALNKAGVGTTWLSLSATNFDGLYDDIFRVGDATARPSKAAALVRDLTRRLDRVAQCTANVQRPSVFCLSWFDPIMAAGSWISNMVERAAGEDRLGTRRLSSAAITIEQLHKASPEVILLTPCSFSQERTVGEWLALRGSPRWQQLPAVRQNKAFTLASSLMHRPGPRLVDGVEVIAGLLHPDCFPEVMGPRFAGRWHRCQHD
jgi:iron complex transport system substrate-binding protein